MELLGKSVKISPTASIFITMNPAGNGYGGRQKLPGNLKQLFRPVAMTVPDNDLIAETLLFSQGFIHGYELGKKIVSVFAFARCDSYVISLSFKETRHKSLKLMEESSILA